ncbi:aldo/keto reductase [Planococcus sp. CP5-4]|uniref:aldo/keto reductase n=1 Tax=unclassified Planococcus (in: firmicutes) TaxID=2662419 RepID=UPI001C23BA4C|nr:MULTISPECIES: aldo/keto reductase [unclassified Planococcus (in: firmicutes)]MBU9674946.1 aldo/keto reductase [Planococcus sp. CP5-4_YE]MBV0908409.1 aldo/keto reductase [Planococcus sp. CP5-4_UN]MBW6062623.1 aldo/keto reductase [Planococcus sp. CP5-4]
MDYINLGKSGLRVPKYILGTVPFSGTNGFEAAGNIQENEASRMIDMALEAGINMFDTANLYSQGNAEKVLGAAIRGKRDKVLLTSKTGFPFEDHQNARGASRSNLLKSIDESLLRLGTDYLDLYFVHLWDGQTPVEETVETMNDLIKAGKIRHWGVSNYSGWALAKTHTFAEQNGKIPPATQQIYYTPEAREAEYELLPAGAELGVSSMIWSPLGEGLLNGKVGRGKEAPKDTRQGGGWPEPWVQDEERLYQVIDALEEVAANHNASVPQIAYAWVRDRPNVGPIVIAARNEAQLQENIASYKIKLKQDEHNLIEKAARPVPIYPNWHRAMSAPEMASPSEIGYLKGYKDSMGIK